MQDSVPRFPPNLALRKRQRHEILEAAASNINDLTSKQCRGLPNANWVSTLTTEASNEELRQTHSCSPCCRVSSGARIWHHVDIVCKFSAEPLAAVLRRPILRSRSRYLNADNEWQLAREEKTYFLPQGLLPDGHNSCYTSHHCTCGSVLSHTRVGGSRLTNGIGFFLPPQHIDMNNHQRPDSTSEMHLLDVELIRIFKGFLSPDHCASNDCICSTDDTTYTQLTLVEVRYSSLLAHGETDARLTWQLS